MLDTLQVLKISSDFSTFSFFFILWTFCFFFCLFVAITFLSITFSSATRILHIRQFNLSQDYPRSHGTSFFNIIFSHFKIRTLCLRQIKHVLQELTTFFISITLISTFNSCVQCAQIYLNLLWWSSPYRFSPAIKPLFWVNLK